MAFADPETSIKQSSSNSSDFPRTSLARMSEYQREEAIGKIQSYAASLINRGQTRVQVLKELQHQGLTPHEANMIYDRLSAVQQQTGLNDEREAAFKSMAIGGLICVVGIVVTVGSYSAVARTGGSYTIAYGAIIFGGLQFLRGLYAYSN